MRKFLLILGILLVLSALVTGAMVAWGNDNAKLNIITVEPQSQETLFPSTETVVSPDLMSTTDAFPTEVPPTTTPLVQNYVFNNKVDLSSGDSIVLLLGLPDNTFLPSNWASARSFSPDDPVDIFSPNAGVVYSYEDIGIPVTWAHAGVTLDSRQPLFADNFDRYLRKDEGLVMSLVQAQEKANGLIGQSAIVCQDETGSIIPLSAYDSTTGCIGKTVTLQIVAFTIVPYELVSEYDSLSVGILPWMATNFPGVGFDFLSPSNSWVIRFCVGRFYDQITPGNTHYFINRAVIAFRVWE